MPAFSAMMTHTAMPVYKTFTKNICTKLETATTTIVWKRVSANEKDLKKTKKDKKKT